MSSDERDIYLLVNNPHESINLEIKSWLRLAENPDRCVLIKAVMALANSGGGHIIIGMIETNGQFSTADASEIDVDKYSQDYINGIVNSYCEPPFQVKVSFVQNQENLIQHPVLTVPGQHRAPIVSKRASPDQKTLMVGKAYIRRPGPESAEPANASEWRELFDRCIKAGSNDLLDAIRGIMTGSDVSIDERNDAVAKDLLNWRDEGIRHWRGTHFKVNPQAPEPYGYYCVAYKIIGPIPTLSLIELKRRIDQATVRYSGWSPWWVPTHHEIAPKPLNGMVECNLDTNGADYLTDPAHQDFWRVSPDGKAMLIRGFTEDSKSKSRKPREKFDLSWPVRDIGECLLQAAALAKLLSGEGSRLIFSVKWVGLAGRELASVDGRRFSRNNRVAIQDTFQNLAEYNTDDIDLQLPEILFSFLKPLYELFDFTELSKSLVNEEILILRSTKY